MLSLTVRHPTLEGAHLACLQVEAGSLNQQVVPKFTRTRDDIEHRRVIHRRRQSYLNGARIPFGQTDPACHSDL